MTAWPTHRGQTHRNQRPSKKNNPKRPKQPGRTAPRERRESKAATQTKSKAPVKCGNRRQQTEQRPCKKMRNASARLRSKPRAPGGETGTNRRTRDVTRRAGKKKQGRREKKHPERTTAQGGDIDEVMLSEEERRQTGQNAARALNPHREEPEPKAGGSRDGRGKG